MSEQPSAIIHIYYDTNVLAYISDRKVPEFLNNLSKCGVTHVTSDTAIDELLDGVRTEVISQHPFHFVYSHEALFVGGSKNIRNVIGQPTDEISVDGLEIFLRGMLRSASGSRSVPDLSYLLRDGITDVVDSLMQDLPEGTDARTVAQFSQARVRILEGLEAFPDLPMPIVSKEEMDALKLGPKYLGNIRPPRVVSQIAAHYPDASEWVDRLVAPFKGDEDVRGRIQELCLALILAGFARDKGIAKDDIKKSEGAAQSQFRDISHICAAVVCDLFITADKRCAKLAYAVFEALNLTTDVLHLVLGKPEEVNLVLVGKDYWP